MKSLSYLSNELIFSKNHINCKLTINYDERYALYYPKLRSNEIINIVACYPEHNYEELKKRIRERFKTARIVFGAGGEDLIIRVNRFAQEGHLKVAIVVPIFYRTIETCKDYTFINEIDLFSTDFNKYDLVWINNPNLFSGKVHDFKKLSDLFHAHPNVNFILDEAAIFSVSRWKEISFLGKKIPPNVTVINSFSKMFGLAGLRIAFASGCEKILDKLESYSPTFPITSLSQYFAQSMISKSNFLEEMHKEINLNKRQIKIILKSHGVSLFPSEVNCIYFKNHDSLCDRLEALGIICLNMKGQPGIEDEIIRMTVHSSPKIQKILMKKLLKVFDEKK